MMTTPNTQPTPTAQTPVGQWVAYNPAYAHTFENLNIDFCCGGKMPLDQACQAKSLETSAVIDQLQKEAHQNANDQVDCTQLSLTQLCQHIVTTHHHLLLTKMPYIQKLIQKVVNAHGHKDPRLAELLQVFTQCKDHLLAHMQKEEQILFPMIANIENPDSAPAVPTPCDINNPIRMMELEHDDAGQSLAQIKQLTDDYQIPQNACTTYRIMLHELQAFEKDMHQHIHKENNILFPAAAQQYQAT